MITDYGHLKGVKVCVSGVLWGVVAVSRRKTVVSHNIYLFIRVKDLIGGGGLAVVLLVHP